MSIRKHVAPHRHVASDIIGNYAPSRIGVGVNKNYVELNTNGYIDIAGVSFGDGWGDLYRQSVTVGETTYKLLELSGTGLILDGFLNVNQISMNMGELSLGRYGGDGGYIYFTDGDNVLENDARIAQVTIAGQTLPVVAIQSYTPDESGKYGYWGLGSLDISNLFVDHIIASSGSYGVSMFSPLRLAFSTDGETFTGVKLYDSLNDSGSEGDVLTVAANGKPVWGIGGAGGWSAGTVTTLDSTYFQIINYSPNTITRVGYNRFTHSSGTTISDSTGVMLSTGRVLILTCAIGSYQGIQSISQTGVSWTKAEQYGYFGSEPYVNGEIWYGILGEGASQSFTITFTGDTPAIVDIMGYSGLDPASPLETHQSNSSTTTGSPTDTGTVYTTSANDLIIGCIAMPATVTQSSPLNGFTLVGNSGIYNTSLGTLELFTTITSNYASGTSTSGGRYVGMIAAFKAASQDTQQKLTMVGSSGGGEGVSYSATSPIKILGNVISFDATATNITALDITATDDMYCDHIYLQGVIGANISSWSSTIYNSVFTGTQSTVYGTQTSGDFYVPNSMKLAGLLQFSYGSKACGLIWSNDYTLSIIADSGSPFAYKTTKTPRGETVDEYTAHFGVLNVGAVYTQIINNIGTETGVTIATNLTLGNNKYLVDAVGTSSYTVRGASPPYALTVNSSGYPVWTQLSSSGGGGSIARNDVVGFFDAPFWGSIPDKPQELGLTSNVRFNNLVLTGTIGTTGDALTITPDVNFAHANTVYVNADSTNGGAAIFNLQCNEVTKGAFGYKPESNKTYLIAYADNDLTYSQMHILGSKIILENDAEAWGLFNVNNKASSDAVLNIMSNDSTKGAFGYDYSSGKTYLVAYTDSTLAQSQLHLLGSKIVIENDTDFIGRYVNISGNNPVLNLQHNGSNRVDLGFDGTNNYFRSRNAGNLDVINESGSIAFTCSSGLMYLAGGAQFCPTGTGGSGQLGNNTNWWKRIYIEELWTHNYSGHTFDCLDDLSLVKQYGEQNPVIPTDYDSSKVKPKPNDIFSFLKSKDGQFYNMLDMVNFSLGCSKALAKKNDETSDIMLALYDGIDAHDLKIQALEAENDDLKEELRVIKQKMGC